MGPDVLELILRDESETRLFAEDTAMALAPGDCLCLSGDLGAGKSTFARALIRAMADDPDLDVPSPTFTLVQSYETRLPIGHFDLYRLTSVDELEELGLDDALSRGAALVEWPERAGDRVSGDDILFRIDGSGDSRRIRVTGPAGFMQRLARSRLARTFLAAHGHSGSARRFLQGDASARTYEMIRDGAAEPVILMNSPRRPDGPPIQDGLPYSRIAHLAEDVVPFVAVARWLRAQGFSAPDIPAADTESGFLLVENLGSQTVLDAAGRPDPERYGVAVECLAALHERSLPGSLDLGLGDGQAYRLPAYDEAAMRIEVALLVDWYLPWRGQADVSAATRQAYFDCWDELFGRLQAAEKAVVLRDYHSPNLIWCPERGGLARIGIIDFQDALIGPAAYDVASLLQDARVTVPVEMADRLLGQYEELRAASDPGFDRKMFREAYAIMAAQRAAKILGIFVRLKQRDGKPGYLKHLPRIEHYISTALGHEALRPLRSWFTAAGIGTTES
ncbi:hypothetical protein DFR52_103721 [Hoeflea marina]|uniref:tRNA threonylcarbamoyladenosine biosynthesis protein TsaE n=1 Tax=Hoeflea marina TaxID=274592 RepID=A0A317PJN8_9HYPH|nr:tRNA (adenosine(37)-N6)-threonylcarbamoyltransferase complex ATPase subunit type 1 TsaE [Hoeflea marina]PWW00514.1 hypothetical protein DFR52_103721 [Hoeflea marina]